MSGQIIVPGFGDMTQEVIRELTSGRLLTAVRARAEQNAIAREEGQLQRYHLKFGRLRARISEEAYFYWGERLGYECWNDKGFLREFERDNPEVRVKSAPRAVTLRVNGRREASGGRLEEGPVLHVAESMLPAMISGGGQDRMLTKPETIIEPGTILDRTGNVCRETVAQEETEVAEI